MYNHISAIQIGLSVSLSLIPLTSIDNRETH
jgi:hypothetical protein